MEIYLFGGSTIDLAGRPTHKLVKQDSNPGKITISYGGVARNVATNLANLGVKVHLVTVISDDPLSIGLLKDCQKYKIDVSNCLIVKNEKPSIYMSVQDSNGDMDVAINDMEIMNKITPESIKESIEKITEDDAVFMDTNLSEETIAYLLHNCKGKIYVDPVSTFKATKLAKYLDKIYAFKPNAYEAAKLSQESTISNMQKFFHTKGIKKLFISDGSSGVYASDGKQAIHLAATQTKIVNATGAGDSFMAGIIFQDIQGKSLLETIQFASIMSKFTLEAEETTTDLINKEVILKEMREKYGYEY